MTKTTETFAQRLAREAAQAEREARVIHPYGKPESKVCAWAHGAYRR